MADQDKTPEELASERARNLVGLLWHAGTYVIINAFLWAIDIIGGDGVNWAYWVTISWGIGLAFHALAYFIDERGLEARKTAQYLEEARRGERDTS